MASHSAPQTTHCRTCRLLRCRLPCLGQAAPSLSPLFYRCEQLGRQLCCNALQEGFEAIARPRRRGQRLPGCLPRRPGPAGCRLWEAAQLGAAAQLHFHVCGCLGRAQAQHCAGLERRQCGLRSILHCVRQAGAWWGAVQCDVMTFSVSCNQQIALLPLPSPLASPRHPAEGRHCRRRRQPAPPPAAPHSAGAPGHI